MKKISIVIVDDHKLIREMWAKMFSNHPSLEVTGESGEFDEAIEIIKTKRPDIVLLDINLPPHSGMDAVPLIRKYVPGTKIIAVSMHNQPSYAKKMLQLGAKGYVTKNSSITEIIKAVEEVVNGNNYICTEIKEALSDIFVSGDDVHTHAKNLSLREIEVIKLIKHGYSSKEIATALNIAVRTAEVHRHNILKKLQLKNTAALINYINNSTVIL